MRAWAPFIGGLLLPPLAPAAAAAAADHWEQQPPGNLSFFSWYALGPLNHSSDLWGAPYLEAGPVGTVATGANVLIGFDNGNGSFGTGAASLASISAAWETHGVPSFFTPDKWFQCENESAPLLPGWQQALAKQAAMLHSSGLVSSGAIKGVFYGDELGVCGVPFWAVDAGISYFRGVLGEADGLVHHVNACEMTLGCPPAGDVCNICPPGCGNSSSEWLPRYWPHIPASLDFVSVDVYCYYDSGRCSSAECPGGPSDTCEVATAKHFYEQYIFPKLSPHQRVWLVPGLFAKIEPAPSYTMSLARSLNETAQLAKLAAYAAWTSEEARIVGWMPYHYSNRLWNPSPASGSWGAEVMPRALQFLKAHAPPSQLPQRSLLKADDEATATAASRDLGWPAAAGVRGAEGALPPCPCSPASLCRSLSPQPPARPEVLAFSTAGWEYPNPTTVNKTEPFFFDHYPWDSVTTVAPFVGQGSGSDWGIDAYTPQLVCKAHQHNARVVGHIGHGAATWPAILSPSYRSTWVQQIVRWFVHTQGMDGIQFDIEALSGNYTDAATSLACELKHALTRTLPGSTLSWCSDISPKADPGYNFTRLGGCVDYFVVMEYTHGLGPGWEREFSQGLSEYEATGVRASQIVYALPFFGAQSACCNSRTVPPCPGDEQAPHGGATCAHACWYRNQPCNGAIYPPRPFGYAGFARIMETVALGHAVQYQPQLTPSPFIDIKVNNTGPPANMPMRFRWEFDDPRSVSAKATIMRAAKVGGVGMWTADALDYSNVSRSGAMWRALLGQPAAAKAHGSPRG